MNLLSIPRTLSHTNDKILIVNQLSQANFSYATNNFSPYPRIFLPIVVIAPSHWKTPAHASLQPPNYPKKIHPLIAPTTSFTPQRARTSVYTRPPEFPYTNTRVQRAVLTVVALGADGPGGIAPARRRRPRAAEKERRRPLPRALSPYELVRPAPPVQARTAQSLRSLRRRELACGRVSAAAAPPCCTTAHVAPAVSMS